MREPTEDEERQDPFEVMRTDWERRARKAERLLNEEFADRVEAGLIDLDAVRRYIERRAKRFDAGRPVLPEADEARLAGLRAASQRIQASMDQMVAAMNFSGGAPYEFLIQPASSSCTNPPPPLVYLSSSSLQGSCSVNGGNVGLSSMSWAMGKYLPESGTHQAEFDNDYVGAALTFKISRYLLPPFGTVTITPAINVNGNVEVNVLKPWYPVDSGGHNAEVALWFHMITQTGSDTPGLTFGHPLWKKWAIDSAGGSLTEDVEFPAGSQSPFDHQTSIQLDVNGGPNGKDLTVWVVPLLTTHAASLNAIMGNKAYGGFPYFDLGGGYWSGVRVPHLRVTVTKVNDMVAQVVTYKAKTWKDFLALKGEYVKQP